jgi:hypothetical protein
MRQERLGACQRTEDIHLHHSTNVVQASFRQTVEHTESGVVDQHIDMTEMVERGLRQTRNVIRVADIGGDGDGAGRTAEVGGELIEFCRRSCCQGRHVRLQRRTVAQSTHQNRSMHR